MRERANAKVRQRLEELLVDVAPTPIFSGLEAPDDGVMRRVMVFRRVLVRRVVATADVTARQTEPEMHPAAVGFEALLASRRRARLVGIDLIEVLAAVAHGMSLPLQVRFR